MSLKLLALLLGPTLVEVAWGLPSASLSLVAYMGSMSLIRQHAGYCHTPYPRPSPSLISTASSTHRFSDASSPSPKLFGRLRAAAFLAYFRAALPSRVPASRHELFFLSSPGPTLLLLCQVSDSRVLLGFPYEPLVPRLVLLCFVFFIPSWMRCLAIFFTQELSFRQRPEVAGNTRTCIFCAPIPSLVTASTLPARITLSSPCIGCGSSQTALSNVFCCLKYVSGRCFCAVLPMFLFYCVVLFSRRPSEKIHSCKVWFWVCSLFFGVLSSSLFAFFLVGFSPSLFLSLSVFLCFGCECSSVVLLLVLSWRISPLALSSPLSRCSSYRLLVCLFVGVRSMWKAPDAVNQSVTQPASQLVGQSVRIFLWHDSINLEDEGSQTNKDRAEGAFLGLSLTEICAPCQDESCPLSTAAPFAHAPSRQWSAQPAALLTQPPLAVLQGLELTIPTNPLSNHSRTCDIHTSPLRTLLPVLGRCLLGSPGEWMYNSVTCFVSCSRADGHQLEYLTLRVGLQGIKCNMYVWLVLSLNTSVRRGLNTDTSDWLKGRREWT